MSIERIEVGPWPDPPIPDFDSNGCMCPPWIKYPNLPRRSSGWRMGMGEAYRNDFEVWWSRQPRQARLAVRSAYPEPQEWLGFWESLAHS